MLYKLSWYPRPCGYQEHRPFSAEVDLGCGLSMMAKDLSFGFLSECHPWVAMAYSRLQKCNKQAEQWKTTIDLLCLNREEGHAEAGKIIRFIHGKSIVVFHCSACMLQDFCNLL